MRLSRTPGCPPNSMETNRSGCVGAPQGWSGAAGERPRGASNRPQSTAPPSANIARHTHIPRREPLGSLGRGLGEADASGASISMESRQGETDARLAQGRLDLVDVADVARLQHAGDRHAADVGGAEVAVVVDFF